MTLITPNPRDAVHKAWLLRVLTAIADTPALAQILRFKGGTCAAMRGFLDRFSVDLDFDHIGGPEDLAHVHEKLERVFAELGLEIKDSSKVVPQYFVRYPAPQSERNTIKVEVTTLAPHANTYETVRLQEIDRIFHCHTEGTMFANKLVALLDRYEKHGSIAGRDVYDIHHFFLQALRYDPAVIEERRGTSVPQFFDELIAFVEGHVTQTTLDQDLNVLLALTDFKRIRHILKQETLTFLRDERARLGT